MSDCVAKNCQHDCLAQDEKDPDGVWLLRSGSGFLLRFPLPYSCQGHNVNEMQLKCGTSSRNMRWETVVVLSMHQMNQSDETHARRMLLWVSSIVTLLITPLITTHERRQQKRGKLTTDRESGPA